MLLGSLDESFNCRMSDTEHVFLKRDLFFSFNAINRHDVVGWTFNATHFRPRIIFFWRHSKARHSPWTHFSFLSRHWKSKNWLSLVFSAADGRQFVDGEIDGSINQKWLIRMFHLRASWRLILTQSKLQNDLLTISGNILAHYQEVFTFSLGSRMLTLSLSNLSFVWTSKTHFPRSVKHQRTRRSVHVFKCVPQ